MRRICSGRSSAIWNRRRGGARRLSTAWCSYQSSRWSGQSSDLETHADKLEREARLELREAGVHDDDVRALPRDQLDGRGVLGVGEHASGEPLDDGLDLGPHLVCRFPDFSGELLFVHGR